MYPEVSPLETDDGIDPLDEFVAAWRLREQAEQAAAHAWRARVLSRLPAVARMLRDDLGCARVILFGSVARGEAGPGSDVDLLVDGLALANLIEATVRAERLLGDVPVDLVPSASARPEVLVRAEREGRTISDV
jgi:predicted nucleotidyltransferase